MRKRSRLATAVMALALVAIGASPALADEPIESPIYFHAGGTYDSHPPTATTPQQADSGSLTYAGGNHWKLVGTWSGTEPAVFAPGHFWLGLKNSDDQGTSFDLRMIVTVGAEGFIFPFRCITGVTRNPAKALDYSIGDFGGAGFTTITIETRIGTTDAYLDNAPKCAGHASATGLRFYYDSVDRASGFHR